MSDTQNNTGPDPVQTETSAPAWHRTLLPLATNVKQADGKSKRTVMGQTDCFVPSLDMVSSVFPAPDELVLDKAEDGSEYVKEIKYSDPAIALLQSALQTTIQAPVRSAIIWNKNDESEPVYDGQRQPPAQDFDTFLESNAGGSQFMAIKAAWINGFKAYAASLDIPQVAKEKLVRLIEAGKYISDQSAITKERVTARLIEYVESLGEERASEVESYTNKMVTYLEMAASTEEAFEF